MSADPQKILREAELAAYLVELGLSEAGENFRVEPAGDGNINWVRRVRAPDGRSWIVKQARPRLERFPDYAAPVERIVFEHRYFEIARAFDHEEICPKLLHFDEPNRVLVLADLGDAERLDRALARGADVHHALAAIAAFLGRIHAATRDPGLAARFANNAMRRLHGEHIFSLPLRPNNFPLPDGLRPHVAALQADAELVAAADRALERYLEPRGALLHGDVQPGNVLLGASGPTLLDAEIAHVGDPAFDLGVLLAHVLVAAVARDTRRRAAEDTAELWDTYCTNAGGAGPCFAEVARYAGFEMLRRTIGAARVPIVESRPTAVAVLALARRWILEPPQEPERMELR